MFVFLSVSQFCIPYTCNWWKLASRNQFLFALWKRLFVESLSISTYSFFFFFASALLCFALKTAEVKNGSICSPLLTDLISIFVYLQWLFTGLTQVKCAVRTGCGQTRTKEFQVVSWGRRWTAALWGRWSAKLWIDAEICDSPGSQRSPDRLKVTAWPELTCHVAVDWGGSQGAAPIWINREEAWGAARQPDGLTGRLVDGCREERESDTHFYNQRALVFPRTSHFLKNLYTGWEF